MIVAVTGTPGTGKTVVAKALSKELGFEYVDLNALVEENGWDEGFDKERDTLIVDEQKLSARLKSVLKKKKDYVIDSHLSHFIDSEIVDVCIVCTCELQELKRRLDERDYTPRKVRENLDAEIFEVCVIEAGEKDHKIIMVDTTNGVDAGALAREVRAALEG